MTSQELLLRLTGLFLCTAYVVCVFYFDKPVQWIAAIMPIAIGTLSGDWSRLPAGDTNEAE